MSHQLAADHIQGLLRGTVAYAVTLTGERTLHHFSFFAVRQRVEDQPYGFFLRSSARPRYSRNANPKSGFALCADPLS